MPSSSIRRVHGSTPSAVSSVSSISGPTSHAPPYAPIPRNLSERSVNSGPIGTPGPSDKEPALITSKWGIGWSTPSLMLGWYILAVLIAIAHLLIFQYLDGKDADGPDQVIPQSYVSTASNILANIFGFSLRGALAIAFAQYLWRLLRIETMKVSTIELLFNIRSNLLMLLKPAALRATPILFALAVLMWSAQVVISFPPGALTVSSVQKISEAIIKVPTFNASFMGNGSGTDANRFSLINLDPLPPIGFTVGDFDNVNNTNLINRIARQVLNSGETFPMSSPCGVNCSYVMEFEGPWIECSNTTSTSFHNQTFVQTLFPIYSGQWTSNPNANLIHSSYNGTYSLATFNSTTLTPLSANQELLNDAPNGSILIQEDRVTCSPGRANFKVNNTYINNVQSKTIVVNPIDKLINLAPLTHDGAIKVPGFNAESGFGFGTTPANWSDYALTYYRDNNIMTIFTAMMSWLNGEFRASPTHNAQSSNATWFDDIFWKEVIQTTPEGITFRSSAQNGTIVDSTRFNTAFGEYFAFEPAHPSFNMSQDIMNDYLFNMTVSMMVAYGEWNTTVTATQSTLINVYSFSRPLNLILPYFISLSVALPFIIVGGLALIWNGVPATDGSFVQIVTTSTGSSILDKAAAGGCLGGEENTPQELKDLKIRFGEFIDRDGPGGLKRAGFGVEGEVTILKKDTKYGIARWI